VARPPIRIVGPSAKIDEELRQWLNAHIEQHPHLNTAVLSKNEYIGVSRPALDAYIDGTYYLSTEAGGLGVDPKRSKIEDRIRAYRDRVEGTVRHGYTNKFLVTRAWEQLKQACDTAIEENAIVVAYGKPGVGKSRCLGQYAVSKIQGSLPVQILCSKNITTRYFVVMLARAVNLFEDGKRKLPPTAELEDLIAEKLRKNPRPICVDQANYLNEFALGSVCHIWEKARVPIVLVGTHLLHESFFASNLTEDVRAQLADRVALHYPLSELTNEQTKAILKRAIPDLTDLEVAEVIKLTANRHRRIELMITRILDLRQRNENDLQTGVVKMAGIIQTAGRRLMIA
jgi:DNA transposition AAA+ family ATPase